jgi:hypothetical protein
MLVHSHGMLDCATRFGFCQVAPAPRVSFIPSTWIGQAGPGMLKDQRRESPPKKLGPRLQRGTHVSHSLDKVCSIVLVLMFHFPWFIELSTITSPFIVIGLACVQLTA